MGFFFRLLFFLLFSLSVDSKQLEVSVAAKSAVLINSRGRILYEKNAFEEAYPASITKIATALYALDQKKHELEKEVEISAEALKTVFSDRKKNHEEDFPPYFLESDGSALGLSVGERVRLKDLLYAMMLVSGNDSANALAYALGGGISAYMQQINAYLQKLGCKKTLFLNPHGLHHPRHKTCAWDMAVISRKALELDKFRQVVSTLKYRIPANNTCTGYELKQTNRLIKKEEPYYYPYAIGIKTGYHSNAGYTLVGAAENGERSLIAVLLGEKENEKRYLDARKLFDAAFSEKKVTELLFEKEQFFKADLEGAKVPLEAELRQNITISFYPSEDQEYKAFIYWDDLALPILKDEKVGVLKIEDLNGKPVIEKPLFAKAEVARTFWHLLKQWCFLAKKKSS